MMAFKCWMGAYFGFEEEALVAREECEQCKSRLA
jgi:hypothetical protein